MTGPRLHTLLATLALAAQFCGVALPAGGLVYCIEADGRVQAETAFADCCDGDDGERPTAPTRPDRCDEGPCEDRAIDRDALASGRDEAEPVPTLDRPVEAFFVVAAVAERADPPLRADRSRAGAPPVSARTPGRLVLLRSMTLRL